MKQDRTYLFESESIPKAVFALSVPTAAASLVTVLYSLADTFFVGLANDPIQTAAVSLAAPVLLAFNAINNLFGVGASSMMSRALGARDLKTVARSSSFGFYGSLFCSLIFSLLTLVFIEPLLYMLGASPATYQPTGRYLLWTVIVGATPAILNVVMAYLVRAEGATSHAALGTMSGCFLNILLDPVFILGFGMGAEGAALATLISNCFAVLYFIAYVFIRREKTVVSLNIRLFSLKGRVPLGVFAVGVPASIQNLLNVAGQIIANNLAAGYGTEAVAAMGIGMKVAMVPMYAAQGISQGVMPLVGYNYASLNITRMKEAILFTAKITFGFLAAVCVVFELFPSTIVRWFIQDPTTVAIGQVLLRGLSLAIPFLAMDFLAVGVFQAAGKGNLALFMAICRKVILEIPFMFLFDRLWPMYGLGFSQFAAEFIMTIIGTVLLVRFLHQTERSVHDQTA